MHQFCPLMSILAIGKRGYIVHVGRYGPLPDKLYGGRVVAVVVVMVLYCTVCRHCGWFVQHFYWCFNALPTDPVSTGGTHSIGTAIKEKGYLREYRNQERVGPSYTVRRPRYEKGTMLVNIGLGPRKILGVRGLFQNATDNRNLSSLIRLNRKMSPGYIYATLCGPHSRVRNTVRF